MNEIYWMTVVGNLSTAFMVVWIVTLIIILGMLFVLAASEGDVIDDEDSAHAFFKWLKRFVVCGVIAAMANIFIPTTKELLYIYGIGGTIDYIRTNDTTKQLPDKCIKALDRFADKYIDEPEKDK
ncbi:hypothetical protein KGH27_15155 [Bacteroides faecis]|jgi:hypothetical protein|uniref:hypothetical protein n=1 Tax=Bacteroides faecis TaxID=674529 RepID=UPI001E4C961A|nr:hypothetical protein [Bacteroides faecis]MCC2068806.1 hypothetical protein [Bacteroides faecis]